MLQKLICRLSCSNVSATIQCIWHWGYRSIHSWLASRWLLLVAVGWLLVGCCQLLVVVVVGCCQLASCRLNAGRFLRLSPAVSPWLPLPPLLGLQGVRCGRGVWSFIIARCMSTHMCIHMSAHMSTHMPIIHMSTHMPVITQLWVDDADERMQMNDATI